jgi:glycosyltransferase involved in cell wall biosynthesis
MLNLPPPEPEIDRTPFREVGAERLSGLSAFVPARDEEPNLVPLTEALLPVLCRVAERWELIIVNDGSRDRTGAVAEELARLHPGIRVVHHRVSRGYGAAIRAGLTAARYDHVFFTDGDQQFDPRQLRALVPALARADVVVGYRRVRADPLSRRISGMAWNALVRRLFHLPVRDVNCAFKLLRRDALAGVELEADGAMVSTELIAKLIARGRRVVEVPVEHRPRLAGRSSGGRPRVIARAFVELSRLHATLRRH